MDREPAAQPDNPMGTDGFEFVEFAAPDPAALGRLFAAMGFAAVARHRHKDVLLYRQGDINFIVNAEPDSFAQRFAREHGPSICALAFRVRDAAEAYRRACALGAWGFASTGGPGELAIPAIKGIGDSLLYFVDRWRGKDGALPGAIGNIDIYDVDFAPLPGAASDAVPPGLGLRCIDHLTHNVHRGRMDEWGAFYARYFNFREVRYFDLEGQVSGIRSRAMVSPCGKIRIPINEEGREQPGQIQEYLERYHGEGVQHVALATDDLAATVDGLRAAGVRLLDTPDIYYEAIDARIPKHGEDVAALRARRILIDGEPGRLLLQIFSENQIGPIFFEFIQRKGNEGFGEGNFRALFESIELDQIRRGAVPSAARTEIAAPPDAG